jgi:hypothetical protein
MTGAGIAVFGMWIFLAVASFADAYQASHAPEGHKGGWSWTLLVGAVLATMATGALTSAIGAQPHL